MCTAAREEEEERRELAGLKETGRRIAGPGSARQRRAGLAGSRNDDRRTRPMFRRFRTVMRPARPAGEMREEVQPRGG